MEKGFCHKCGKEVYMKREDIDICLCIILAIFTAGIGLLIYMVIYLDKKENRCIHCNSICSPLMDVRSNPYSQNAHQEIPKQIVYTKQMDRNSNYTHHSESNNGYEVNDYSEPKFCYNCGSHLHDAKNARFCIFCGAELD